MTLAPIADADEDNVEAYAAGGAPVVIGSIDTGVDLGHAEFAGRLIAGRDWYNNDGDPTDDRCPGVFHTPPHTFPRRPGLATPGPPLTFPPHLRSWGSPTHHASPPTDLEIQYT
ncbi:MAG: hypothetical protein HYS40_03265 [Gemmatimonadetes bacterium]|nr:hypothetical protein [Gemmatimonadota bacterium]